MALVSADMMGIVPEANRPDPHALRKWTNKNVAASQAMAMSQEPPTQMADSLEVQQHAAAVPSIPVRAPVQAQHDADTTPQRRKGVIEQDITPPPVSAISANPYSLAAVNF